MTVRLKVLDGARTIGGTKLYLEEGEVGFLVDFGLNYGRWGRYFEEYLKPRTARGLYDLWKLGLVPPVEGLYRDDLCPSELWDPQGAPRLKVRALLISHAHMDHCGLLGVLRPDLPLYASPQTLAILRAVQDTGKAEFYSELCYCTPRAPNEEGYLEPCRDAPAPVRPAFTLGADPPEGLCALWSRIPRSKKYTCPPLRHAPQEVEGVRIRAYPVDHSVPGSVALTFEGSGGLVVYTGDFRTHGRTGHRVWELGSLLRRERVLALVVEGTRLGRERQERITEQDVLQRAMEVVDRSRGRLVVADFGPRHVERLETFLQVARACGRRLVALPKDGYLLEALSAADPTYRQLLSDPHLVFLKRPRLQADRWLEEFLGRHRSRLVDARTVRTSPGEHILAMGFYDVVDLLDIEPEGGVYVYSSSEAYGEDGRVDMWRLWNWIQHFGMEVHGFRWVGEDERGRPEFTGSLHASGHVHPEDLLEFIRTVQPAHLVPLHTEHPEWFAEHLRGEPIKVHILENGEELEL